MNITITELSFRPDLLEQATDYFWKCWGTESNYKFYRDCIFHSTGEKAPLPKFYIVVHDGDIIASCALLTNDIISRQDLMPWLACLFVNENFRNQGIAGRLLEHGLTEAAKKGFEKLYLSSDLENFYERKGWKHIANGFNLTDTEIKIYAKSTS